MKTEIEDGIDIAANNKINQYTEKRSKWSSKIESFLLTATIEMYRLFCLVMLYHVDEFVVKSLM